MQQATSQRTPTRRTYLLSSIPLLLALLAYYAPTIMDEYAAYYGYGETQRYELPPGVMDAFRSYDHDGNGFLDPYEFAPIGMLVGEQVMHLLPASGFRSGYVDVSETVIFLPACDDVCVGGSV